MRRCTRRLAHSTAAVAVAALTLAGCSLGAVRAGAAAIVGPHRISETQLREAVEANLADPALAQSVVGREADYQRNVLARLIAISLLDQALAQAHATVTDADIAMQQAQIVAQAGGESAVGGVLEQQGLGADQLHNAATLSAKVDVLGRALLGGNPASAADVRAIQEAAVKRIMALGASEQVRVNPRFGAWNNGQLAVDPSAQATPLSTPAPPAIGTEPGSTLP